MRVFVAGAGGAIGRRLVPQLVARGHEVIASTTRTEKLADLRALGAEAVVMDGLDAASVEDAVARAEPETIVHQMTSLAGKKDLRHFDRTFAVTNELRTTGTKHLLVAGEAVGVERFVAQSSVASGPLASDPPKSMRASLAAIRRLEFSVLNAPLEGIVLRYGAFYGPGASDDLVRFVRRRMFPIVGDGAGVWSWVHIDDAASATVAAVERGHRGTYDVVDDEPAPVCEWLPYLAETVGAKPPRRIRVWLARLLAGEIVVSLMTQSRGASNAKAKRELGWQPRWTWRTGFREGWDVTVPLEPQVREAI
jgi:nucleoside-diphosphate-sugar epimerase